MITIHKIRIYPTKSQEILLNKSCGVARFSYNWALNQWKESYNSENKVSAYSLIKQLNSIKREQFPWMLEVSKNCPQYAIHNLENAFKRFFKKTSKYPKFKKKNSKNSFVAIENKQEFRQKNYKLHVPRIGKIKCAENLRFDGKVNNVVIKKVADMWFAMVNIEILNPVLDINESKNQAFIGVDLGIKTMITLSDGTTFDNPKALSKNLRRLKLIQRRLSKKVKDSNNRKKQQIKVARLHYKISCIRKDAIHKATAYINNNYNKIVIENLDILKMLKNKKLSRLLHDVSFGEIIRQLEYKSKIQGNIVIKADRFFPSSKLCSCCGHKKVDLKLSERIYNCINCGLSLDRDLNAAKNLASFGTTQRPCESQACGEGSSIVEIQYSPSMKQEIVLSNKNLTTNIEKLWVS